MRGECISEARFLMIGPPTSIDQRPRPNHRRQEQSSSDSRPPKPRPEDPETMDTGSEVVEIVEERRVVSGEFLTGGRSTVMIGWKMIRWDEPRFYVKRMLGAEVLSAV